MRTPRKPTIPARFRALLCVFVVIPSLLLANDQKLYNAAMDRGHHWMKAHEYREAEKEYLKAVGYASKYGRISAYGAAGDAAFFHGDIVGARSDYALGIAQTFDISDAIQSVELRAEFGVLCLIDG